MTPVVVGARSGPLRDLEHLMAIDASPVLIAGLAGRALESLCDHLSTLLPIQTRRRVGDQYTIGDLWDPIKEYLRASGDPGLSSLAELLPRTQFLRNKLSAH